MVYGMVSTMKLRVTMDRAGRLVLPRSVRQSLNTPPTAVFEAEVVGNRLELTLADDQSSDLERKGQLLVVSKQGKAVDAVSAVEETRKERL
jgi:bifunctional DNA-binding transcriptional regulator/antitoxin component of YhaV-PrlF toxin-antitoxin module